MKKTQNNCKRSVSSGSFPSGIDLLNNPFLNKGTAFTEAERKAFHLHGLLPPGIDTIHEQVLRVLENVRRNATDIVRYMYMIELQNTNRTLFYRVMVDYLKEMMPLMYTPTVGAACQTFAHLYSRPRGIYISVKDRGRVKQYLSNWPHKNVGIIVVTDGERILGLGDLGANGMGIPIGKLALYTACGGINPELSLPVTIDAGTNNTELLNDPVYNGLHQPRVRGTEYDELVEEFIVSANELFPNVLIQFEDFANTNAFRLLNKYRDRFCVFNDDIQGTASAALAGLYASMRITGSTLKQQKILFLGAGEAGIGIADLIVTALMAEGLQEGEARRHCWFVDSKGLVVKSREGLAEHKLGYAHDHEFLPDFIAAINQLQPTVIIGVSAKPGAFSREVIESMSRINSRPVIFPLSNPTANAECTAYDAYTWSDGRAVFASGSPFEPVALNNRTYIPGQGNNAYIFPGVGLGIVASSAIRVTDEMFFTAARILAEAVTRDELEQGSIYPDLTRIREISTQIAAGVAKLAYKSGATSSPEPENIENSIESHFYEPVYKNYV